eukprot:556655-Pelagomonas_calceolata.AAC.1
MHRGAQRRTYLVGPGSAVGHNKGGSIRGDDQGELSRSDIKRVTNFEHKSWGEKNGHMVES